jgi:hypothetical protein
MDPQRKTSTRAISTLAILDFDGPGHYEVGVPTSNSDAKDIRHENLMQSVQALSALFVLVVLLVTAGGCAEAHGPDDPAQSSQALEAASPASVDTYRPWVSPRSIIKAVDPAQVEGFPQIDEGLLKKRQHEAAGRSPIPALLPNVERLIEVAVLMSGEDWYAASMVVDDHGISIHGSRRAFFVPGMDISNEVVHEGAKHLLNRSEGVVSLTFEAFGVAYMMRIDCERPFEDARCTEDDYIIDIAEALAIVPGAER